MAQGSLTQPAPTSTPRRQRQPLLPILAGAVHRVLFPVLHLARAAPLLHRRRPDESLRLLEQAGQRAGEGEHFLLDAVLSSLRRHHLSNVCSQSSALIHTPLYVVFFAAMLLNLWLAYLVFTRIGGIAGNWRDRDAAVLLPRQAGLSVLQRRIDVRRFLLPVLLPGVADLSKSPRCRTGSWVVWGTLGFLACLVCSAELEGDGRHAAGDGSGVRADFSSARFPQPSRTPALVLPGRKNGAAGRAVRIDLHSRQAGRRRHCARTIAYIPSYTLARWLEDTGNVSRRFAVSQQFRAAARRRRR